jgi:hypothetical protein
MRQPATACPGIPAGHQVQENRVICCAANIALHSHSIINEPSKLLICKGLTTASKLFTVSFTVNLIRASKIVRRIYRHLSMAIGKSSRPTFPVYRGLSDCTPIAGTVTERPCRVRKTPKWSRHQTPQAVVLKRFFAKIFTVTTAYPRRSTGSLHRDHVARRRLNP